jgi:hypothetical protein
LLRIGDRVEEHEPDDAATEPIIGVERQTQSDPSAKGMADDRKIAQVLVLDELGEQFGLIEHRIALVERLVGLAETLEVDGDDPVRLGKLGDDVPPRESACAKPMQEEDRRSLALFLIVEVDRSLGRTKPSKRTTRAVTGAQCARAEDEGDGRSCERRLQLSFGHAPLKTRSRSRVENVRQRPVSVESARESARERVGIPSFSRSTALRREAAIASG